MANGDVEPANATRWCRLGSRPQFHDPSGMDLVVSRRCFRELRPPNVKDSARWKTNRFAFSHRIRCAFSGRHVLDGFETAGWL